MEGQRHVPATLPPGNSPGIHCTGGWQILRTGLDVCGKNFARAGIRTPNLPAPQRVAISTTLHRQTLVVVVVVMVVKKVVEMEGCSLCPPVIVNVMVVLIVGVSVIYIPHDIVYPLRHLCKESAAPSYRTFSFSLRFILFLNSVLPFSFFFF